MMGTFSGTEEPIEIFNILVSDISETSVDSPENIQGSHICLNKCSVLEFILH